MKELRINFEERTIVMTRKFAKAASDPFTTEFAKLQEVREAYPNFKVKRHTIKKNPNKECYKGLTYDYMREYIKSHESKVEREKVLATLEEKIYISKCHSNCHRYPTVKKWFLEKYPHVATFGTEVDKIETREQVNADVSKVEEFAVA